MKKLLNLGDETGSYFNYEIINDELIEVNYGWSDYEESSNNSLEFYFNDKIKVVKIDGGYSVYDGDYNDNKTYEFNDIDELLKWLLEEI